MISSTAAFGHTLDLYAELTFLLRHGDTFPTPHADSALVRCPVDLFGGVASTAVVVIAGSTIPWVPLLPQGLASRVAPTSVTLLLRATAAFVAIVIAAIALIVSPTLRSHQLALLHVPLLFHLAILMAVCARVALLVLPRTAPVHALAQSLAAPHEILLLPRRFPARLKGPFLHLTCTSLLPAMLLPSPLCVGARMPHVHRRAPLVVLPP